jgi:hypothetical protein
VLAEEPSRGVGVLRDGIRPGLDPDPGAEQRIREACDIPLRDDVVDPFDIK